MAKDSQEQIAIIGIGCRLPGGANTPDQLWSLLREGVDAIGPVPKDRWDVDAFYHSDAKRPGKYYIQEGGYLEGIDLFDAQFFGVAPREASRIDPQQRILLEMAWEALEDAGQPVDELKGSDTGVFIGLSGSDYGHLQYDQSKTLNAYSGVGSAGSIAANRLSYFFDWRGPSMAVDTACSSSMVAFHQACRSLWSGESSMCLAGGIGILLQAETTVGFCKAGMLSPNNRCFSFDAAADGYVRSEGGGVLVLKPLSRALADGNPIYATILATASNSDGRTQGIFLPSAEAQETLLREVYEQAGVDPADITYIEAHGTGTPAGDPVECTAIGKFLAQHRDPEQPCLIGSIKSNIGHLEAASGMAGLIKVALALKHREIPGNLHFNKPNPNIPFDYFNLRVVDQLTALPASSKPRVMGANSFGFGGANAHAVLREFNRSRPAGAALAPPDAKQMLPLVLSARGENSLTRLAEKYASLLRAPDPPPLYDVCHSSALRRTPMDHRIFVFGETHDTMARNLEAFVADDIAEQLVRADTVGENAPVVFVFSGNGPQWWGMGRELLEHDDTFRGALEKVDEIFEPLAGWSIIGELTSSQRDSRMEKTEYAQPALLAVQAGLLDCLRERGVQPGAAIGHSVGEVAAAYASGALSLEEAVRVIHERSRAQGPIAGQGKMAAVGLPAADVESAIRPYGDISLAGINSPNSVTISGDPGELEALGQELQAKNIFFRMLQLNYPFHSPAMDAVRGPLVKSLRGLQSREPVIPFISTVNGDHVQAGELDATYWWNNVRKPVRFHDGISRLMDEGYKIFLEVGPHPVLTSYIVECAKAKNSNSVAAGTLRREEPEAAALWTAAGRCYTLGGNVDLETFFPAPGRFVPLPSYPWDRERHWFEQRSESMDHPLLGYRSDAADARWTHQLDTPHVSFLSDHQVRGSVVFPAAAYVEMALAAAKRTVESGVVEIEDLAILRALVIPEDRPPLLQFSLTQEDGTFRITSRPGSDDSAWSTNVTGRLGAVTASKEPKARSMSELRERIRQVVPKGDVYEMARAAGLEFGPKFQGLEELWTADNEAFGIVSAPDSLRQEAGRFHIHPALLDTCFHVMLGPIAAESAGGKLVPYLPVQIGRLRFHDDPAGVRYCHARLRKKSGKSMVYDLDLFDGDGRVLAEIEGFRSQQLGRERQPAGILYEVKACLDPGTVLPAANANSPLPSPAELGSRLAPKIPELKIAHGRGEKNRDYRRRRRQLASGFIAAAMRRLVSGDGQPIQDVLPLYERLVQRYTRFLKEEGLSTGSANGHGMVDLKSQLAPNQLWRQLIGEHPERLAELMLLGRCGEHLADILTGKLDPLTVFSISGLEHLYESSPVCAFHNAVTVEAVKEIVQEWPSNKKLRILDVGAGTGGLTTRILPYLPADITEYVFTDVSELFLSQAEGKYDKYRFMRYARLDIGQPPQEQGFNLESYDIVLAGNALHVTSDLERTLGHVNSLLRPDGLLFLLEVQQQPALDITFALLKDWWNFEDSELRGLSPVLNEHEWPKLLTGCGFDQVEVLNDGEPDLPPEQSLYLARKPAQANAAVAEDTLAAKDRRSWLILAGDDNGRGRVIADELRRDGHRVVIVEPGPSFSRIDDETFQAPADARGFEQLCGALNQEGPWEDVIHLRGLHPGPVESAADLAALQETRCLSIVSFLQAMQQTGMTRPARIWLVTRGAVTHPDGQGQLDPPQAPLWGLGRVLANEYPDIVCHLVDLNPRDEAADTGPMLLAELRQVSDETAVLLSKDARYVHRIQRVALGEVTAASERQQNGSGHSSQQDVPFTCGLSAQGSLDNFFLQEVRIPRPGAGQILVKVEAAGLNFRDVMWALGALPEEAVEDSFGGALLGLEFSGVVAEAGPGAGFEAGQAVLGFARSCFGSHVIAEKAMVTKMPARLGFTEAATIPSVFVTSFYALDELARLKQGETVLIHGAAGGVGLAALQIAKWKGAEVFATAGTPEKREFLELLGADHVLDSRSLSFADGVAELTGGQGVDVVLNSLAGELMYKSLTLLKPFGRFLEIGKRDLYANSKVGLRPFRNNISYFAIDADQIMSGRPGLASEVFGKVTELIDQGVLNPLVHRSFPASRLSQAFRHMQQSKHVGKIVITMETEGTPIEPRKRPAIEVAESATYLITGGLSGFGLATAKWLVNKGARNVVLVGRSGASTAEARSGVAEMEAAGANVVVARADVAQESDLRRVLEKIENELPPLRGVLHSAMVLEDVFVSNMSTEQWQRVVSPKMLGAWNLHHLTQGLPLDFFVMYSSSSALVGNPGQGNYCAGNLYLEALAHQRRSQNLPGFAVGWGIINDVGIIARTEDMEKSMRSQLRSISSGEALDALGELIAAQAVQVSTADYIWHSALKLLPAGNQPYYDNVRAAAGDEAESSGQAGLAKETLLALPPEERLVTATQLLAEQVARILRLPAGQFDVNRSLAEVGLDSLMAMELQLSIEERFGVSLPSMEFAAGLSTVQIAARILGLITTGDEAEVMAEAASESASPGTAATAVMSQTDSPDRSGDRTNDAS